MLSSFTGPSCRELAARHADADEIERENVRIAQQRRNEADAQAALESADDIVWVTEEDLDSIVDQGSVVVFTGIDNQERVVTFGVDHRPARDIIALVHEQGSLPCSVEDWQVLRRTAPVTVGG